jgi:prevent-host-death family protein
MLTVAVAEIKARLSSYLKRIKAGEEILITERGTPVARLVPLKGGEVASSRRRRLAEAGLLRLGSGRRSLLLKPAAGHERVGAEVLQALLEERREGR